MLNVSTIESEPSNFSAQDRLSQRIYHSPGVERTYLPLENLEPGEVAALLKYQPAINQHAVLDIGVGTGRTTPYLIQLAASYLAIDYSPVMVECFKCKFPNVPIRQADMRDLSFLPSESIDFVMASCNVLDVVSHEHRLMVLHEMRRVIRSHGVLLFSSHNRSFLPAFRGPRLRTSRNPFTQARYLLEFFRQQFNHFSTGKLRRIEPDYALLDDVGHDYRLLHYYIDRATQLRQLARSGFDVLDVYTFSGRLLTANDQAADSPILYYVAAKRTDSVGDR